jgi:hypothetical protein
VYLSSDEFLDLERARLTLRAHGIGADRGRLVREALALLMTDLEAGIDASVIARRLREACQPDPAGDAPVAMGPASGAPADGARVNGGPAEGVRVNGGVANGGPAVGVLANGIGVTGLPEGPQ